MADVLEQPSTIIPRRTGDMVRAEFTSTGLYSFHGIDAFEALTGGLISHSFREQ
jgi:hypothetical protein